MTGPSNANRSANVTFRLFLGLWNRVQGQSTPEPHHRIAFWLERAWANRDRRLLLMAFRSCGKSTIVGLFIAWLLTEDPNLRILVLAGETMLARRMVRNVRRIIERHPLTPHLKPERLDQWGADRFTVTRSLELRDPSVLGRGVSGNITGSRADVIVCDDVEVPRTCDTADKRALLRERLAEAEFVLAPGGTTLYVGTPHSWFTIYADAARAEIGEDAPFLADYKRLKVPIVENGASAWPERYPMAEIEAMRRRSGPNRFASQMMLQPVNIAEGRLDPAALVRYAGEPHMSAELKTLYLDGRRLVAASAWWDPSFGGAGGDGSVVAVIFTDDAGARYLHRVAYLNAPAQEGIDEATRQCRLVVGLVRDLRLPSIAIETNGIGKFLPAILRRELGLARVPASVLEKTSSRAKDLRILEAFDVVLAARLLHVHDSVYRTPFIAEMQEWRPGGAGRDDGLDAVSGALGLDPVRLERVDRPRGGPDWRPGGGFTADTDFRI